MTALDDVSLEVSPNEVVGVIGPNGAGKTTLFNAICGFVGPDAGEIQWRGRPLGKVRPHRRAGLGIARTLQGVGLFAGLTVLENVMVGAEPLRRSGLLSAMLGLPRSDRAERALRAAALHALRRVDAADVADRLPASLPYPIQKRVALARALVAEPQLLLLDEPAGGLGADDIAALGELVRGLEESLAVMVVEHRMDFVTALCDRVVVLDFGRVIAAGTPAEIATDAKVLEAYLGYAADETPAGLPATLEPEPDRARG